MKVRVLLVKWATGSRSTKMPTEVRTDAFVISVLKS